MAPVPFSAFQAAVHLCKPNNFSGEEKGNISTWLFKFERFCEALEFSDKEKVQYLSLLLDGSALQWYMLEDRPKVYEAVKAQILARFGPHSADKWQKLKTFRERKKRVDESVDDFGDTIRRMGNELGQTDTSILQQFVEGFETRISNYLKLENVETLEQARQLAMRKTAVENFQDEKVVEKLENLQHKIVSLSKTITEQNETTAPSEINSKTNHIDMSQTSFKTPVRVFQLNNTTHKEITCLSCGGPHLRRFCKDKNAWCNNCLRRGHRAETCRKKIKKSTDSPKILCAKFKANQCHHRTLQSAAISNSSDTSPAENNYAPGDTHKAKMVSPRLQSPTQTIYADFNFEHLNTY